MKKLACLVLALALLATMFVAFGEGTELKYDLKGMTVKILRRLKFDNDTIRRVTALVRWHDERPEATERVVRRAVSRMGEDVFNAHIGQFLESHCAVERFAHGALVLEGETMKGTDRQ